MEYRWIADHFSDESSTCGTTIVCCNANDVSPAVLTLPPYQYSQLIELQSIQICIGSINVNIVVNIE